MGYKTPSHCINAYDPSYIYQGIGTVVSSSLVNTVYAKIGNGPIPYYPIIHGGHFDERDKIHKNDYNIYGKHLVFMVEYFGDVIGHIATKNMYLLYDNNVYIMQRIFGDKYSGFYALNFKINDINNCKPYAFFAVTETFDVYRLPEDTDYYFSTSMISNNVGICNINHFYYEQTLNQWFGNGSPFINNLLDIHGVDNTNCLGCQETNALSIKFDETIRTLHPTPKPTIKITKLTYNPSVMPSQFPSAQITTTDTPTDAYIVSTINNEESSDDNGNIKDGNNLLCCHGSNNWWDWLCKKKLHDDCISDWKCYFDDNDCMYNEYDNTLSTVFESTLENEDSNDSSESKSDSGWIGNWRNERGKKESTFSWKWEKSSSDSSNVSDEKNEETKENEQENTNDWKHKWNWDWST
eukprot:447855_1